MKDLSPTQNTEFKDLKKTLTELQMLEFTKEGRKFMMNNDAHLYEMGAIIFKQKYLSDLKKWETRLRSKNFSDTELRYRET